MKKILPVSLLSLLLALGLHADDGHRLWLRYDPVEGAPEISALVVQGQRPGELKLARELERGLGGLLGKPLKAGHILARDNAVVVGTPATSRLIRDLRWDAALEKLGPEGYLLRSTKIQGHPVLVIASLDPRGALYGSFELLRLIQTGRSLADLDLSRKPAVALRLLDHWDNLDGSVERGYAGRSLWKWDTLPKISPRIEDYARANASLGLNGTVLNNVNADARSLDREHLKKTAALADALRPWGIKVYLSANFAAPKHLGGLKTSDPLDQAVARWWKLKADEIYTLIPDFGGFLVKANSEGQSGPQDYGRSHAEGANMLAKALAPHQGIVMWRAFVYNQDVDPDRIKRAYKEFTPLDGKFDRNVAIQAKNGPLDFNAREPFHPLFGAMQGTPMMAELQVTQEYLGHATHLVYLAPMWQEFLNADTWSRGQGSLVAGTLSGIAGVANTGDDANWCGHPMAQANWHAFGRLAWDPTLKSEDLAEEWIRMSFGNQPELVASILGILLASHQAYTDYCMPLGLNGVHGKDFHYEPMPWNVDPRREDWSATYFVRADKKGLGFDRSPTGSNGAGQYFPPLAGQFGDLKTCPEDLLCWFHHVPWGHRMRSGRSFWQELSFRYDRGARQAAWMKQEWENLKGQVDGEIYERVEGKLTIQAREAREWGQASLEYFKEFSGMPIGPAIP